MEINKCMGCMEEFRGYPCPDCGYVPEKQPYALPMETILNGKYLVGRVLGLDCIGFTYIGWDIALERKVAIKEYYPLGQVSRAPGTRTLTWHTIGNDRQDCMRIFLEPAWKMARVGRIPNVVRILELFQESDTVYIVMDFVEGQTLHNILQKRGPMGWEQAQAIFRPAIHAMERVHAAGLIHRDISPDKLMISPNGSVTILYPDDDRLSNTLLNVSIIVYDGFRPPVEQQYIRGGELGPWTDVYAMAATIYYTLTGKLPPKSIDRYLEDTIRWDYPGLLALPVQTLEALKKAMTVRPKMRTQTMAELEKSMFPQVWKPEHAPGKRLGRRTQRVTLAAGFYHTVGLRSDGTVVATGRNAEGQCNVSGWRGIVAVAAGGDYTVGLRSDGTVVATGDNEDGECEVSGWTDIVAVAAGSNHTVGLRRDGTVVATGSNSSGQCGVSSWRDIVAVAAGDWHTVGLRSDGTMVVTELYSPMIYGDRSWRGIVAVAAKGHNTVGLRSDGTVVTTGSQYNVSGWRDIVAVAAGHDHTVGLRSDGTVVATGVYDYYGHCNVSGWTDIVAVAAGQWYTVGLRSDGTVVFTKCTGRFD